MYAQPIPVNYMASRTCTNLALNEMRDLELINVAAYA
jgi:hypothetical protein